MLDPFLPENPDDVARLKAIQREIHAIFIALVKGSRGARLKGADDVLFTGEYWAGETSVSLGLADGIGDLRSTLRAPLRREGADPRDRAGQRDAVRAAGPEVARRGLAGRARRYRGTAGRPDFGAGDPGNLGQIRVLKRFQAKWTPVRVRKRVKTRTRGGRPRHLVPDIPIAGRAGLGENTQSGADT